jgi:hypothetical protein
LPIFFGSFATSFPPRTLRPKQLFRLACNVLMYPLVGPIALEVTDVGDGTYHIKFAVQVRGSKSLPGGLAHPMLDVNLCLCCMLPGQWGVSRDGDYRREACCGKPGHVARASRRESTQSAISGRSSGQRRRHQWPWQLCHRMCHRWWWLQQRWRDA